MKFLTFIMIALLLESCSTYDLKEAVIMKRISSTELEYSDMKSGFKDTLSTNPDTLLKEMKDFGIRKENLGELTSLREGHSVRLVSGKWGDKNLIIDQTTDSFSRLLMLIITLIVGFVFGAVIEWD